MTLGSAIANASPLIALGGADLLDTVLVAAFERIVVPRAVVDEVRRGPDGPALLRELGTHATVLLATDPAESSPLLQWDLGAGETEVIAHALADRRSWCLLDDRAARRVTGALGLRVIGTAGLLVHAELAASIPSARGAIEQLWTAGFRLSETMIQDALRRARG